jgi:hypothetical protein
MILIDNLFAFAILSVFSYSIHRVQRSGVLKLLPSAIRVVSLRFGVAALRRC